MDHAEEQALELEALEAIYMDDYVRIHDVEPAAFELKLVPETGAGEEINHVAVILRVAYKPTYPEVPPDLSVRAVRGLDDTQLNEIKAVVDEAAQSEDLVGTAMVYAIAERTQEWLVRHNFPEQDLHAQMMARLKQQGEADQLREEQTAEADAGGGGVVQERLRDRAKASRKVGNDMCDDWRAEPMVGSLEATQTPVTPKTFAAWKALLAEREHAAAAAVSAAAPAKKSKSDNSSALSGLSGRQIFERSGGEELALQDAGMLEEDEEDAMALPREAMDEQDEGDAHGATEGEEGENLGSVSAVLAEVGNEALFEDEDLPDDLPPSASAVCD